MALVEIALPPGFYRHGTDLEGEGRWRDGNLVRWRNGSLRPVRGWVERVDAAPYAAPVRGMHAWQDYSLLRWIAAGSFNSLYVTTAVGTTSDITPVDLVAGSVDATINTGYGGGFYGTGFYGVSRPDTGNFGEAATWSMDTWGQFLVACCPDDGRLFEWQLDPLAPAAPIANAPTNCLGVVATEERFLFALGAGGNPRRVQWCDFEDNTIWTPSSTNQAGDIELQTSGQIMLGLRAQGQTVVITDQDAHRFTYIGPPFVYQVERIGTSCGATSRRAAVNTTAGVFWIGQRGFFRFDGSTVQELPCDVWDHVFTDINAAQISKIWAVNNGQNSEVWWFYPSSGSTEVDRYVAFDYTNGAWMIGRLERTAGVERGVFRTPVYASSDGMLYNHETGWNYDGALPYAETGPFKIGAGDNLAVVHEMIPDEQSQGEVNVHLKSRLYPNSAESVFGPYTIAAPTSVRMQGRQIRMRVTGVVNDDWRVGKFRLDVKAGSKR